MNKLDKELEKQRKIDETRQNLEELVAKYEDNEKEYITLAAEAKADNRMTDYKQTLVYLKVVMARKAQAKSMLHQFKLIELNRDEAKASKAFMDSMLIISKETNKLFNGITVHKTTKNLRKMSSDMEKNQMLMTSFLETTQASLGNLEDETIMPNVDKEVEERINQEVDKIRNNIDSTPDDRLQELLGNTKI